jgi:hypothetical protein
MPEYVPGKYINKTIKNKWEDGRFHKNEHPKKQQYFS